MNLLAILAALGLEQWHAFRWRAGAERTFVMYIRQLERKLNGGTAGQGAVAAALAIVPTVAVATLIWRLAEEIHPLLGLVWNAAILYLLMGFRRFSHAVSVIIEALKENDIATARRALSGWRGGWVGELGSNDIARLSIEQGLTDAYRQVFAVLFWFIVLPGPAGAVLYRAAVLLAHEWKGIAPGDDATPMTRSQTEFGRPARGLLRSEEHTSELQSRRDLVCRLLLEKKTDQRADLQADFALERFSQRRRYRAVRACHQNGRSHVSPPDLGR